MAEAGRERETTHLYRPAGASRALVEVLRRCDRSEAGPARNRRSGTARARGVGGGRGRKGKRVSPAGLQACTLFSSGLGGWSCRVGRMAGWGGSRVCVCVLDGAGSGNGGTRADARYGDCGSTREPRGGTQVAGRIPSPWRTASDSTASRLSAMGPLRVASAGLALQGLQISLRRAIGSQMCQGLQHCRSRRSARPLAWPITSASALKTHSRALRSKKLEHAPAAEHTVAT